LVDIVCQAYNLLVVLYKTAKIAYLMNIVVNANKVITQFMVNVYNQLAILLTVIVACIMEYVTNVMKILLMFKEYAILLQI
jgi:hypothetical protein